MRAWPDHGLEAGKRKVELPEYLEISADVKNFSLPVTVTLATNEAFAALDAGKLQDADALKEAADKLTDAMTQLLDGSNQLYNGLNDLKDGTTNLNNGINQLAGWYWSSGGRRGYPLHRPDNPDRQQRNARRRRAPGV